jgi:hypothetical protein
MAELEAEEVVDGVVDDQATPPQDDPGFEAAAERRARRMGWTPFAEFRGDPSKWRPASEWLARADEMLPISRALNHSLETKLKQNEAVIGDLKRTVDEQSKVLTEMRDLARRADERGYQRALAEIEAAKRSAVAEGNQDRYDQLVEQAETLTESRTAAAPKPSDAPPPAPAPAPQIAPEIEQFVRENPWFRTDKFLGDQMIAKHSAVMRQYPDMPLADQLDEALSRLRTEFPQEFPSVARRTEPPARPPARASAVAPPSRSQQRPNGQDKTGINSITDPAERAMARQAFERFRQQMPGFTEAEYMQIYENPHGDVLDLQRTARAARKN